MSNKPIKLNFSSLFEDANGLQGKELLAPGHWAIVKVEANNWGHADVIVVNPIEARKQDIVKPQDLLIYFAEGLDVSGKSKNSTFKLSFENNLKPNDDTKIDDGVAEISYGGYGDNGVVIEINYFLFKDVTVEKITQLVEKTFTKEMRELIKDIEFEAEDDKEYAKNPSAYYGVSNSDFVSSSEMKRKF